MTIEAKQALRTMGFRAADAKKFVEAVLADRMPETLEALIVAALQRSR